MIIEVSILGALDCDIITHHQGLPQRHCLYPSQTLSFLIEGLKPLHHDVPPVTVNDLCSSFQLKELPIRGNN